jgi:hypothetical protein
MKYTIFQTDTSPILLIFKELKNSDLRQMSPDYSTAHAVHYKEKILKVQIVVFLSIFKPKLFRVKTFWNWFMNM